MPPVCWYCSHQRPAPRCASNASANTPSICFWLASYLPVCSPPLPSGRVWTESKRLIARTLRGELSLPESHSSSGVLWFLAHGGTRSLKLPSSRSSFRLGQCWSAQRLDLLRRSLCAGRSLARGRRRPTYRLFSCTRGGAAAAACLQAIQLTWALTGWCAGCASFPTLQPRS